MRNRSRAGGRARVTPQYPNLHSASLSKPRSVTDLMCCTREASFATEDFWIHPEVAASDIFAALQARDPGVAQRAIAGPQNTAVSAVLNIRQLSPVTACYITIYRKNIDVSSVSNAFLITPLHLRNRPKRSEANELGGPRTHHSHITNLLGTNTVRMMGCD